jgi:hypothetical protein
LILAVRQGIWPLKLKKWLANKFLKLKCEKCLKNKISSKYQLNLNGNDL